MNGRAAHNGMICKEAMGLGQCGPGLWWGIGVEEGEPWLPATASGVGRYGSKDLPVLMHFLAALVAVPAWLAYAAAGDSPNAGPGAPAASG